MQAALCFDIEQIDVEFRRHWLLCRGFGGRPDHADLILLGDAWLHVDAAGLVDMGDLAVVAQCWMERV